MAKNREPVKQVESESESGEEDDNGSSGEDDSQESDSESEQTQTPIQNNSAAPPPPPPPQSASSAEEEESGSEAESESEGLDSNNSPVASNGGRSTPIAPLSAKRPAEYTATPSEDAKKTKIDDSEASEKKSNMFQRLWTEEDEIFLLEGMLDYTNEMKSDPIAELNDFHDFVKEKLHKVFTNAQLQDKIRRLKKKFENNSSKEKEGKEKSFSKPHEQKAYDLSKMIWGDKIGSFVRKTPKKKLNLSESEENDVKNAVVGGGGGGKLSLNLISDGSSISIEEKMLIMGREYFEAGLGIEGENEWQKMKVMEWELNLKQLQVRVAQTKLVLGGLKAEDH